MIVPRAMLCAANSIHHSPLSHNDPPDDKSPPAIWLRSGCATGNKPAVPTTTLCSLHRHTINQTIYIFSLQDSSGESTDNSCSISGNRSFVRSIQGKCYVPMSGDIQQQALSARCAHVLTDVIQAKGVQAVDSTTICDKGLPRSFWGNAVRTSTGTSSRLSPSTPRPSPA